MVKNHGFNEEIGFLGQSAKKPIQYRGFMVGLFITTVRMGTPIRSQQVTPDKTSSKSGEVFVSVVFVLVVKGGA